MASSYKSKSFNAVQNNTSLKRATSSYARKYGFNAVQNNTSLKRVVFSDEYDNLF